MSRTRVLLTGASGSMGNEAFQELLRRSDRVQTRLLLRPSAVNKKRFAPYEGRQGLEIVWGDVTELDDVCRAVEGVEFVLHAAAMISPAADRAPEQSRRINAGGAAHLVEAIRRQPRGGDDIRFVFVGSVAQYGDRLPPHHRINVGDPLMPSVHDYYALSKCEAETTVIESGLRGWASLRQTYIAIPDTFSLLDPIMFHQPLDQHIELITSRDAGYGLVQCIEAGDDFWGRIYNMSGGPACRVTYQEYIDHVFRIVGLGDHRRVFERNWFATRNFHCGYFEDSHVLDAHLGHFRDDLHEHYRQLHEAFPAWMRWGSSLVPAAALKLFLRRLAEPLEWIANDDHARIDAFFGSREHWDRIPAWDWEAGVPGREPDDHSGATSGSHPLEGTPDVGAFARSRGGKCLSPGYVDRGTRLLWECSQGHRFEGSPRLLMEAGYWCPECAARVEDASGWDYARRAQGDPALARIHRPVD